MSSAIAEITGLSEKDCFYIVERYKSEFSYPLHKHPEYELNFVQNASGVKRVVGDSVETIGDYDLVLIAAENLEHVWEQGNCKSTNIREITIQCNPNIFSTDLLDKNQFHAVLPMQSHLREILWDGAGINVKGEPLFAVALILLQ